MKKFPQMIFMVLVFLSLTSLVMAQQKDSSPPANPLVRLLQSKGIITPEEAASISQAGSSPESQLQLAKLLLSKGLISQKEYDQMAASLSATSPIAPRNMIASLGYAGPVPSKEAPDAALNLPVGSAASRAEAASASPTPPAPPPVIPAVAPTRVLGLAGANLFKPEGLIPVIKIGNDVRIKPYGFFKASLVQDSSSPGGNDFPLPGFLGDTGPNGSPEFHATARSARFGADFEWLDPSKQITVTGKVETDFEGNFSRVNNRNVSTIARPALQLRLAYVRIDKKFSDKTSAFGLFGFDWTPFGSSTLPPIVETTGVDIAFGSLYERAAQFRFGIGRDLGGERHWKFQPEFALVMPAFGNLPTDLGNQLGFGERQGADSNAPELQGRFVTQFQLDPAPAVAPAQLIASWMYGQRSVIVPAANVPAAFRTAFPTGAQVDSSRYGFSLEAQLPTRWATLLLKWYNGEDLRWYFAGALFSEFNDPFGLTGTATGASLDGSSSVIFGTNASGAATLAPSRPVRAKGGLVDLSFPLSRLFNADPNGRNAGWTLDFNYSFDEAVPRDVRHVAAANRSRDDVFFGNVFYKFNKFLTFAFEESYYRTRAANHAGALPLFRGIPSYQWHDLRQQLSVITTF